MKTKVVYQTNPDGLFLYETVANELALQPGSFNVPYGAVGTPPPEVAAGAVARWTGEEWVSVEDHRGDVLYVADSGELYSLGSAVEVNEDEVNYAGWGPVPAWLTPTAPEPGLAS